MSTLPFSLPPCIDGTDQANALADLYRDGNSLYKHVQMLETQAIFLLMIEALDYPEIAFKSVSLGIPDDDDETVGLDLFGVDPDDDMSVYPDSDEEVGAALMSFLPECSISRYSDFCETVSEPITHDNKWQVAASLFGVEAAAQMERQYLNKNTPAVSKSAKSPRI